MDLIIVNYKSTDFLRVCLSSVHGAINGFPVNVFVFDNGSHDNVRSIKHEFPGTQLIENHQNLGFAKAVNHVLKKTNSKYTVFLNPDAIVKNGFFESVASFMDRNPEVGIVGPKILNTDGCTQGSARAFPTLASGFIGRRSVFTRLFPNSRITCANILSNSSDGKTPMKVDWVSGACMFARREAIEDVGLFDERFFLYWEDVDLCKRLAEKGWKVVYHPQAEVEHRVGGSSEHNLIRSILEFHKSAYRYFIKHTKSYRFVLRPFMILSLSLRFVGILLMHAIRRMILAIFQKEKPAHKPFADLAN